MLLAHQMNPHKLQSLLPLTKTRKDLAINKHGSLWADENSPQGTLRCLGHMYTKKKAMRGSILHRFIIMGNTWKLFKQVPTVFIAAADGKAAHFFYASYEPIKLNHEDILHQAFDRHGIIHQPSKIGTVEEVRAQAAEYNEYEEAPDEYALRFDLIPLKTPNLQPKKRPRIGTNITNTNIYVAPTQDNDSSSSSDTF